MEKRLVKDIEISLDQLFEKALEQRFFTAAAWGIIHIGSSETVSIHKYYGTTILDEKGYPVNESTFFDLASLTKPLVTSLLIFQLIENGVIHWNSTLDLFFEGITDPWKKRINIEMLLSHSSGFCGYLPFFRSFKARQNPENKEWIRQSILKQELRYRPGSQTEYSDFGYLLLGFIIEKVTGKGIDENFKEKISGPLGLEKDLFFINLREKSEKDETRFAATEQCQWRNKLILAQVHDEHAWLLGGVCAHAGLFGTLKGVMTLCATIMDLWKNRKNVLPIVSSEIMIKALTRVRKDSTWCCGFDTPSPNRSSAGQYISDKSVGHLGFTGTSFWMDPTRDLIMVLLTNRIYPSRDNLTIREFRPAFHDMVITWCDRHCSTN